MVTSSNAEPRRRSVPAGGSPRPTWNFLTNHPVVLIYIVQHPESTVRAIAQGVGLTERATLAILRDLDEERLVERHRTGRRNTYVTRYERLLGMSATDGGDPNPAVVAVVQALISISPEGAAVRQHTPSREDRGPRVGGWEFFTNHFLMLGAIARDPSMTVRDLATGTRITERAAVAILNQLEADGIIVRYREGRRNRYTLQMDAFRAFRGWRFEGWSMPPELVDVAVKGIRAIGRR